MYEFWVVALYDKVYEGYDFIFYFWKFVWIAMWIFIRYISSVYHVPENLRNILFYFPPMQLTSVLRQLCLSGYEVEGNLVGEQLYEAYGVTLMREGTLITMRQQWSYLLLTMAIVLLLVRIEYREDKRRF